MEYYMKELVDTQLELVNGGACECYCKEDNYIRYYIGMHASPQRCGNECINIGLTYDYCLDINI